MKQQAESQKRNTAESPKAKAKSRKPKPKAKLNVVFALGFEL
jgi:hypothetical protein